MTGQALTEGENHPETKYGTKSTPETPLPLDLQAVLDAWPELPDPVKAGIVALVKAAMHGG